MTLTGQARREYAQQHYLQNKDKYADRSKQRRAEKEAYVRTLKESNPCVDCGKKYLACQMQYDHIGSDKVASVSDLIRSSTMAKIKEEIAKCELVCSNCHALRTWKRKTGQDI